MDIEKSDVKELVLKVIGGLLSIVMGIMGFLLNEAHDDIRTLRHDHDMFKAEIYSIIEGDNGINEQLKDIWGKYNVNEDNEKQHAKEHSDERESYYKDREALLERIIHLEADKD